MVMVTIKNSMASIMTRMITNAVAMIIIVVPHELMKVSVVAAVILIIVVVAVALVALGVAL